jgi:hypothetical protein
MMSVVSILHSSSGFTARKDWDKGIKENKVAERNTSVLMSK